MPKFWGLGLQHIFLGGTIQPTAEGVMGKEEHSHSIMVISKVFDETMSFLLNHKIFK